MAANTSGRKLECDCGYVAVGDDDDEFVAAVQAHAYQAHSMKLSAELVLGLTEGENTPVLGTASSGEPEATAVSPGRERPR